MPTPAGKRDQFVTFQRATVVTDDYGAEVPTWADFAQAWAEVKFGTGQERREAAQNSASAPATFRVPSNTKTRALLTTDRISYEGADWDISSVVPFERSDMDITATRRA